MISFLVEVKCIVSYVFLTLHAEGQQLREGPNGRHNQWLMKKKSHTAQWLTPASASRKLQLCEEPATRGYSLFKESPDVGDNLTAHKERHLLGSSYVKLRPRLSCKIHLFYKWSMPPVILIACRLFITAF